MSNVTVIKKVLQSDKISTGSVWEIIKLWLAECITSGGRGLSVMHWEWSICFNIRSQLNLSLLIFAVKWMRTGLFSSLSPLLVLPSLPLLSPQSLTSWKPITKAAEDRLFSGDGRNVTISRIIVLLLQRVLPLIKRLAQPGVFCFIFFQETNICFRIMRPGTSRIIFTLLSAFLIQFLKI